MLLSRRGRRVVVLWCCEFESRSGRGVVQHYVIKFVSDLRQVSSFSPVSSTNKTDRYNITEILLKVELNIHFFSKYIGVHCN